MPQNHNYLIFIGGGYNYGEKFEKYFNDRFFGRDTLIIIYDFITSVLSSKGNNRVLLGSNNWLFYKGDNSIRNYQNLDIFTEEELKKAANYLQKIHNWSQKNNKDFYYIICPDKNKIYGEYYQFVEKINPDTKSRAEQLIRYLNKNTDVTVIYPYKSLLENKQTGLLYWKNDTHWNPLGAYIGYKELASKIAKKYNINIVKYNKLNRQQHPKGDLTNMFIIKKQDKFSNYLIPELKNNATCNKKAGEKKDAKCTNSNGKYRLSIFRDSFTTALVPYLNNTFKEVNYYWRHKIHSNDLAKLKNDTDIIILEQVERSIKHLPSFDFPEE